MLVFYYFAFKSTKFAQILKNLLRYASSRPQLLEALNKTAQRGRIIETQRPVAYKEKDGTLHARKANLPK